MDTVSDIYCHITNNHKISVVFKNKLLFLTHISVGCLRKFFYSLQVCLLILLLMFYFGAETGGAVATSVFLSW